jgi:hypothetical protein
VLRRRARRGGQQFSQAVESAFSNRPEEIEVAFLALPDLLLKLSDEVLSAGSLVLVHTSEHVPSDRRAKRRGAMEK